jgi:nitric oxide reductase NorQ protein
MPKIKYYFMKTVFEKGRPRFMALNNQVLEDGTPMDTSFNIQGDQDIRNEFQMETVFCTDKMEKHPLFYTAGKIWVMDVPNVDSNRKPTQEMEEALRLLTGTAPKTKVSDKPKAETLLTKLMKNPLYAVPSVMDGFYIEKEVWYFAIRNIKNSINTLFVGPTGTGKTELAMRICTLLGMPYEVFDMGSMLDPISSLIGTHRMHEGKSIFDYARFTEVLPHPGASILDEISRAPASSNNILFPVLDSRRALPAEIACKEGARNIKLHVDHTIIGTANIGGAYTGTNQLDLALEDRFVQVEVNYMPPDIETQVLTVRTNIDKSEAMIITKVADSIRKAYINNELSKSISTRHTLQIGEMIRDGFTPLDALKLIIIPRFPDEERAIVKGILSKS